MNKRRPSRGPGRGRSESSSHPRGPQGRVSKPGKSGSSDKENKFNKDNKFSKDSKFSKHAKFSKDNKEYKNFSKVKRKQAEDIRELNEPMRINRFLSVAGICSRREADKLIEAGLVTINGKVCTTLGTKVKPSDEVHYNGQAIKAEAKQYLLLNKPKGFITTMDDPRARKTVMDLIGGATKERIYPVGRLDRATTGVLLFTNDGEMAKKLTHPSHGARKIYSVQLDKSFKKADFDLVMKGIELEDGIITPDALSYADEKSKSHIGIELHSGKNRVVRRIFEKLGYEVIKLDRTSFAGLTKKGMNRGHYRFLTKEEVNFLKTR